ncbi:MAG: 50S ribosomal protein L10 [Mycoplasma sp.]|nr:50S ribosomal protein L10 [Mycoplasma sp.]
MSSTNRQLKEKEVSKIKDLIDSSNSLVVIKYQGLTVKQLQMFRKELKTNDFKMKIYKNRLVKKALESTEFKDLNDFLVGPNMFIFASKEELSLIKTIATFAKKFKLIKFIGGIYQAKVVSPKELIEISLLPSYEEALGILANSLFAPLRYMSIGLNQIVETTNK